MQLIFKIIGLKTEDKNKLIIRIYQKIPVKTETFQHEQKKKPETQMVPGSRRGSPSWTRTNDPAVNSRMLYRLSY